MSDSKPTQEGKKLKRGSSYDKFIITVFFFNIASYFVSTYLFIILSLVFISYLMLKFVWDRFKIEQKMMKYKWYKKIHFYWIFRKIRKQSKSMNQTQALLAKYLMGIPIEEGEDEVKTFIDVQNHLGENWPFMVPVKDTRDPKVTVKGKRVECISSYTYLDLAREERIQEAAIEAARRYSTGNHGPRMLCGNLEILEQLEEKIAKFFRRESALVFSSGYLACMSTIAGVARKGDLLLMDRLSHASLRAGAKLSSAKTVYFKHNDFKDAEKQIKKH